MSERAQTAETPAAQPDDEPKSGAEPPAQQSAWVEPAGARPSTPSAASTSRPADAPTSQLTAVDPVALVLGRVDEQLTWYTSAARRTRDRYQVLRSFSSCSPPACRSPWRSAGRVERPARSARRWSCWRACRAVPVPDELDLLQQRRRRAGVAEILVPRPCRRVRRRGEPGATARAAQRGLGQVRDQQRAAAAVLRHRRRPKHIATAGQFSRR